MNFELTQFQTSLDNYQLLCNNFAGAVQSNLDKLMKNFAATQQIFSRQEDTLTEELAKQKSISVEKDRAVKEYDESSKKLTEQIERLK